VPQKKKKKKKTEKKIDKQKTNWQFKKKKI
jgi:hypothetical protein